MELVLPDLPQIQKNTVHHFPGAIETTAKEMAAALNQRQKAMLILAVYLLSYAVGGSGSTRQNVGGSG
jgi:hypothetical protein